MSDKMRDTLRPKECVSLCVHVLPIVLLLLLVLFNKTVALDINRLAVLPFADTQGKEESIPGLGDAIASRLTSLFVQYSPQVQVISQTALQEIFRQQGMSDIGLIDPSHVPQIGKVADADHFWTGTYTRTGYGISVDAVLWSVEEAAAVKSVHASLGWFFPSRPGHIDALVCQLFSKMYQEMFSAPISLNCPSPSLLGEIFGGISGGFGFVRMGALNNVIREANVVHNIQISEFSSMPNEGISIGYVVVPEMFAVIGNVGRMQGEANAGGSANISIDASAIILSGGVRWVLPKLWEGNSDLFIQGAVGWGSATMEKKDISGLLDCPARIVGNGITYAVSVGLSIPMGSSWGVECSASYALCQLPTTSIRVPTLDFSGVSLGVSFSLTFGGAD